MIMSSFIANFMSCAVVVFAWFVDLKHVAARDSVRFCQSAIESAERDQELHVQSVVTSKQQQTLTQNAGGVGVCGTNMSGAVSCDKILVVRLFKNKDMHAIFVTSGTNKSEQHVCFFSRVVSHGIVCFQFGVCVK